MITTHFSLSRKIWCATIKLETKMKQNPKPNHRKSVDCVQQQKHKPKSLKWTAWIGWFITTFISLPFGMFYFFFSDENTSKTTTFFIARKNTQSSPSKPTLVLSKFSQPMVSFHSLLLHSISLAPLPLYRSSQHLLPLPLRECNSISLWQNTNSMHF